METQLTKEIKKACFFYKPEMPSKLRTLRYAEEVQTPTGYVDVIRFEDYIKENHSFCALIDYESLSKSDLNIYKTLYKEQMGDCKIKGEPYPNAHCTGCVFHKHAYTLGVLTTCFEVKISVSDFKSKNGHNFHGNRNYYAVPQEIYEDIKGLVPEDIGILTYHQSSGQLRKQKECVFREISYADRANLLYDAMKKWCDGKQTTNAVFWNLINKYKLYDFLAYIPQEVLNEFK